MGKSLLIDANSIGYAAHNGTKLMSGGMQTQAVFGFIRGLRDMRQEYEDFRPMVLWDGHAQWRYDMLPVTETHVGYKGNRANDPKKVASREAYALQRPFIARACSALGVRQITASGMEADDMAGLLVSQFTQTPGSEVVLMTGDGDWIQMLRAGVTWRDRRDDAKVVTMKNLMDKTGYPTPLAFLEGKCLQGDTSDCIPGVGRIGETLAPQFIAEFGSVRNFWKMCDEGTFKPRLKSHLALCSAEGRANYGRNLRLMQLLKVAPPPKETVSLIPGKFDEGLFVELCEELAFGSILRNINAFTRYFKP